MLKVIVIIITIVQAFPQLSLHEQLVQIKDCAEVATARKMEEMMEDKKFQQKYGACFTNQCYSEKEMEAMTKMMEMMAGMQCWDKAFTKACTGHIKENLMSMASNMLAGR